MSNEAFYVTKHALTGGIIQMHLDVMDGGEYATDKTSAWWTSCRIGKDCFRAKENAIIDAEKRRVKKIASLEKQLTKLRSLKFD